MRKNAAVVVITKIIFGYTLLVTITMMLTYVPISRNQKRNSILNEYTFRTIHLVYIRSTFV